MSETTAPSDETRTDVQRQLDAVLTIYRCPICGARNSASRSDVEDGFGRCVDHGVYRPAVRPAEPPGELREQVARWLCEQRNGAGGWDHEPGRRYWLEDADALLSGPVAPLLADQATVKRVEALVAFYDRHEYSALEVDDLRRALDGS